MEMIHKPSVTARQESFHKLVEKEAQLLLDKGADYTAGKKDQDAYANFRLVAMLLEGAPITPYTVAMVYKLKHIFSLLTFCKTGRQESGEGLEGRHMDDRNYSFILNELVPDHLNYFMKGGVEDKTDTVCASKAVFNDSGDEIIYATNWPRIEGELFLEHNLT